ncbi:hypothetical protein Zmor_006006 [Zophobas morio]|uniref:Endonuclease/exonuclease/phosphatase domain-containing protein n=1 Tax=Zophobas morio TaxID=2755281 RepID=A0AA38IP46_9CUCU|nr:hypothetical protein Zmor_006006 [Zophobas morio]
MEVEFVKNSMVLSNSTDKREKMTYVLPYEMDPNGVNDLISLYEICEALRQKTNEHGVKRMDFNAVGPIDLEHVRKVLEYIFLGEDCKIRIVTTRQRKRSELDARKDLRKPEAKKIVVKGGHKSYAELLRNIKEKVDITKIGIELKSMRKTKKGDMLLEVKGEQDKAKALSDAIKGIGSIHSEMIRNERIVQIIDIEAAVTKKELAEDIMKASPGLKKDELEIKSLRETTSGIARYRKFLDDIGESVNKWEGEMVVAGDFNAKSPLWGYPIMNDLRGSLLEDWMAERCMVCHNCGNAPTFLRGAPKSHIDLTLSTEGVARRMKEWRVLEQENLSDHQDIVWVLGTTGEPERGEDRMTERGWSVAEEKMERLAEVMKEKVKTMDKCKDLVCETKRVLEETCDRVSKKKGCMGKRKGVYWWTEEIADKRKGCLRKISTFTSVRCVWERCFS